ncbi:type VI secretion system Vgr family protein [Cellvibrio sp. pealriver]|uniref:type VI secretion system Vgr family protein n=1 Tax=Cellvibrio sp. pealriver TaxID=1622269 RepID=UPI00066FC76F|nr:type VI secretion system tip protein TssI/VgrG [Cellvibrio sp. pealriver]
MKRNYNLLSHLPPQDLRFVQLSGEEEISKLFNLNLLLQSPRGDINPTDMIGKPLTVEIAMQGGVRHINGQCSHFICTGKHGRHYVYQATIQPWLWYATRRQDYRIFQHKTVPEMVQEVLGTYGFELRLELSKNYRAWEYCVQYRETDANFVMRMLEHEGIWFWFDHKAGSHALVITDDIGLASPAPGCASLPYRSSGQGNPNEDFVTGWFSGGSVTSGDYAARDYSFKEASALLDTQHKKSAAHPFSDLQIFDYPGGYYLAGEGDTYAQVRMEELHSQHQRCTGQAAARGIAPGRLFTLAQHTQAALNKEYLIISCTYLFQANDYEADANTTPFIMDIQLQAQPSSQPFRPQRLTEKPISQGPDTAVITGPAGKEIHTDEFGRVIVQFQWDRYGKKDENSSCWIRVSHPWAGSGFGGVHVPRIGQEVLVDYLNGDPDRPVITNRVYNNLQPHPWGLPANATQSGFLTRSTPKGTAEDANAFRFEDKIGEEQIWIHAQRNQDIEVEHDETHWVGNDRSKTIDRDETVHVKRNRTETVDNNETITIGNDRTEDVGANEIISIGENQTRDIGGHKLETILKTSTQNVLLARMDNVGAAYSLNVGAAMNTLVGLSKTEQVLMNKSSSVGKSESISVGDDYSLTVSKKANISIDGDSIIFTVGKSTIEMLGDGTITMKAANINLMSSEEQIFEAKGEITLKAKKVLENP